MDTRILFKDFCKNSDIDVPTILAPIHTMWPGGVRASRLNIIIASVTLTKRKGIERNFKRNVKGTFKEILKGSWKVLKTNLNRNLKGNLKGA